MGEVGEQHGRLAVPRVEVTPDRDVALAHETGHSSDVVLDRDAVEKEAIEAGRAREQQPGQPDPHETVSLIYDDRRLLETRVRRLASPRMYSQEPRSRTSRMIANVSIEDAEGRAATVRSKFVMIEYRREQQRLFAGTAWHRLVQIDGAVRIA